MREQKSDGRQKKKREDESENGNVRVSEKRGSERKEKMGENRQTLPKHHIVCLLFIEGTHIIQMPCRVFLSASFIHRQFDLPYTHIKRKVALEQKKRTHSGTCSAEKKRTKTKHMFLSLFR